MSTTYYEKIREAYASRRNAIEQLRALDDETDGQEMNEEQRSKFDKINADIDRLDDLCNRWIREGELEERSNFLDQLVGKQADDGRRNESGFTPIEQEVRALCLPPSHPEFRRNVDFHSDPQDLNRLARRSLRRESRVTTDILAGTATDGAELVPTTLFGELYVSLREGATSMFSLGRDIVTASGEAMVFPTVTAFSEAVLVAEAAALTENSPQFSTVTMNAYKYGLFLQVSHEFGRDNAVPGAMPWIIDQAVDGIRRGVGAALVTADGSSKPNGVDNNSTTTSTATGVTFPTGDNLINATHDIASPYRTNAVWVFADATVAGIRTIKDTTNQYLWQPGLQAGAPDRLLGAPVYTDSGFATVGANAKIGVYGDLKKGYLVRTVSDLRAQVSDQYAWINDLNTWRFVGSFDGEIIDAAAYTVITNEAS